MKSRGDRKPLRAAYAGAVAGACLVGIAHASVVIDPSAGIKGITRDPVRPAFYLSLDSSEVAKVDIPTSSIVARVPVPNDPRVLVVDATGTKLYVALERTNDVGVIDLATMAYDATIDVPFYGAGPTGLAIGRPGRLYAVGTDGLAIIDTAARDVIYAGEVGGAILAFRFDLGISPDAKHLHAIDGNGYAIELNVETDCPYFDGQSIYPFGSYTKQQARSPDGSRLYVAGAAPTCIHVLVPGAVLYDRYRILTPSNAGAVAASLDGSVVYAGYGAFFVEASNATSLLPFHLEPLQGALADGGLALSFDDATLAAITGAATDRLELVDVRALPSNVGGVRLVPVDSATGVPIAGARESGNPSIGESDFVDVAAGSLARAPMTPGSYIVTISAPGYRDAQRSVVVQAGQWADLGVVALVSSGQAGAPFARGMSPSLVPGTTMDVEIQGEGFVPGAGFSVGDIYDYVHVNSFSYRSWDVIDANVTVDSGLVPGELLYYAARVINPDGQDSIVRAFVSSNTMAISGGLWSGTVGAPYSQTLTADGGAPPYVWSLAGGALPPGLTLSPGGIVSGTPTVAATFAFTVRATDASACIGERPYKLTIFAAGLSPQDCIVGSGLGPPNENRVRGLRQDGSTTPVDFLAYSAGHWGVSVAGASVMGTVPDQILTGPGPGPAFGPQVRAFSERGASIPKINYYAYGTLRFGANVSAGSIDGDQRDEIVTGPGPGIVFGPHVRGFTLASGSLVAMGKVNYFAYGTLRYGVGVAEGNVDGDAFEEILTAPGPGVPFGPQIRGWDYDNSAVSGMAKVNFNAFATNQWGANVAAGDVDRDAFDEIACTPGPGPAFPARFVGFDYDGSVISSLPGFDVTISSSTTYGGRVGLGDVTGDGQDDLLAGQGRDPSANGIVHPHHYSGLTLIPLVSFDPFPGRTYGVNPATADLGW